MARGPTDVVQVKLRIKERERRQLEAAAESNGTTLNGEMAARTRPHVQAGRDVGG